MLIFNVANSSVNSSTQRCVLCLVKICNTLLPQNSSSKFGLIVLDALPAGTPRISVYTLYFKNLES